MKKNFTFKKYQSRGNSTSQQLVANFTDFLQNYLFTQGNCTFKKYQPWERFIF